MALPTKNQVLGGDSYSFNGGMDYFVAAKSGIDPETMEWTAFGYPQGFTEEISTSTINTFGGVSWSSISTVGGVSTANISSLGGISLV